MANQRIITHFDLDTFFVSVERLMDSSLNNKPVLVGGVGDRGVVSSCSYEARAFGVHSGMPMKNARRLCPEAVVLRGSSSHYGYYSGIITEIIKETAPMYEKASVDEFYLDLTGMDRFFNSWQFAVELRQRIMRETGLPISMGMAANKTVAKIATGESKPCGQLFVPPGTEKEFLAPLPIKKIPMAGKKMQEALKRLGIELIGDLQRMPQEVIEKKLGIHGLSVWNKAHGICNRQLSTYHERKSISMERTFHKNLQSIPELSGILVSMAEGLACQLRAGNKLTACVTVKLRYHDMKTVSHQMHIPYSSCDHTIIERAKELLKQLYDGQKPVRLIGLRCSELVEGGHQMDILNDSAEVVQLYQAMDKLRDKYEDSRLVRRVVGMEVRNMRVFNPFTGEPNTPPAHRQK